MQALLVAVVDKQLGDVSTRAHAQLLSPLDPNLRTQTEHDGPQHVRAACGPTLSFVSVAAGRGVARGWGEGQGTSRFFLVCLRSFSDICPPAAWTSAVSSPSTRIPSEWRRRNASTVSFRSFAHDCSRKGDTTQSKVGKRVGSRKSCPYMKVWTHKSINWECETCTTGQSNRDTMATQRRSLVRARVLRGARHGTWSKALLTAE